MCHRNRVHKLPENKPRHGDGDREREPATAQRVRVNFNRVRVRHGRVPDREEKRENEDERQHRAAILWIFILRERGVQSRPDDETAAHARRRDEPESASSDPVNERRGRDRAEPVPDLQQPVHQRLRRRVGDADGVQDEGEIVGNHRVAGPGAVETDDAGDGGAAAVRRTFEEVEIRHLGVD